MLCCAAAPCAAATVEQPAPEAAKNRRALNFRLIDEPRFSAKPIHDAGMIAQTQVLPNAALGVGLFKSTQRKPDAGEWRTDARATGSRKAAVRFLFKF